MAVKVNGTPGAIKQTLPKKRTCRSFVKEVVFLPTIVLLHLVALFN